MTEFGSGKSDPASSGKAGRCRGKDAENRKQKTEDRGQWQRAEDRRQGVKDGGLKTEEINPRIW